MNPVALSLPKLLDVRVNELNAALEANLSWLTKAYTVCENITNDDDSVFPAIRVLGGNGIEYLSMLPDDTLGNFTFVRAGRSEVINTYGRGNYRMSQNIELIFFFDYREIYNDSQEYSIENVKNDILDFLINYTFRTFTLKLDFFETDHNVIYNGYNTLAVKDQFYMRPYGVLSVGLLLEFFSENCLGEIPIASLPMGSNNPFTDAEKAKLAALDPDASGVVLFSDTDVNTGTKYNSDDVYVRTFVFTQPEMVSNLYYITDIPDGTIKKILEIKGVMTNPGGASISEWIVYLEPISTTISGQSNAILYNTLAPANVGQTYYITIYYTKN